MKFTVHEFLIVLAIVLFFLAACPPWAPPYDPWKQRAIAAGLFAGRSARSSRYRGPRK